MVRIMRDLRPPRNGVHTLPKIAPFQAEVNAGLAGANPIYLLRAQAHPGQRTLRSTRRQLRRQKPGFNLHNESQQNITITMPLLQPQDNFADLREVAEKLVNAKTDGDVKRLAEVVGRLAYRCDLLEREVERLERAAGTKKA